MLQFEEVLHEFYEMIYYEVCFESLSCCRINNQPTTNIVGKKCNFNLICSHHLFSKFTLTFVVRLKYQISFQQYNKMLVSQIQHWITIGQA